MDRHLVDAQPDPDPGHFEVRWSEVHCHIPQAVAEQFFWGKAVCVIKCYQREGQDPGFPAKYRAVTR